MSEVSEQIKPQEPPATSEISSNTTAAKDFLTRSASAVAMIAALTPGPAFAAQPSEHAAAIPGIVTNFGVTPVEETILAEYKRNYEESREPGELEEDAKEKAEHFAKEIITAVEGGGQLIKIVVDAKSSGEAHSEALKHGGNPKTSDARVQEPDDKNTKLSAKRQETGMTLVEKIVKTALEKEGINLPDTGIEKGELSEHMWTDDNVDAINDMAKKYGQESIYNLTEAINTDALTLSPEDQKEINKLLRDKRNVVLRALIKEPILIPPGTDKPDVPNTDVPLLIPSEPNIPPEPGIPTDQPDQPASPDQPNQPDDPDNPLPIIPLIPPAVIPYTRIAQPLTPPAVRPYTRIAQPLAIPAFWLAPLPGAGQEKFQTANSLQTQNTATVTERIKQPRELSFGNNSNVKNATPRGRQERTRGGNRSGKRA